MSGRRKLKLLKQECLDHPDKYEWIVKKGCFERKRAISFRHDDYEEKIGAKVKLLKKDCSPDKYKWIIGKGCFERVKAPSRKASPIRKTSPKKASPKKYRRTSLKKKDCHSPKRWIAGIRGGKPGYCEEPYEADEKEAEEKRPSPKKASPKSPKLHKIWRKTGVLKLACLPPNRRWVKGAKGKPGFCEELELDIKPYDEKEADEKRPISPPKAASSPRHVPLVFPKGPSPPRGGRRKARPETPFKEKDLPKEYPPAFLLRDKNGFPYRQCDLEPEEEIKHPDTSPILKINWHDSIEEEEELLSYYVCNLKQKSRDKEVQEWMDAHPHLADTKKKVLSNKTYKWLKDFLDGKYQMGKLDVVTTMDPKIKAELQQFRFDKRVKAYRGIFFKIDKIDIVSKLCADRIKPNFYYHYKDDRVSSWTWNYQIAENFGKLGIFNFVLQHTFQPKDILVDLRLLHEYCAMRGVISPNILSGLQDEIIILPGDYACEVFDAPFNKNELARPENIPAFQKLWDELLSRSDYMPKYVNFGGGGGGLYGSIKIKFNAREVFKKFYEYDEVNLLFEFKRNASDNTYTLEYAILSSNMQEIRKDNTVKYFMDKPDFVFYNEVNKVVKHLKHPDENYLKAYLLSYGLLSDECKGKCDEIYRPRDYKVYLPYAIKSNNILSLVNILIEDTKALKSMLGVS